MTEPVLRDALAALGRDPVTRERIVAACRDFEALPQHAATAVRDEVTGPIVDALHAEAGVVTKSLANGLVLEFLYRSKIARDLVLRFINDVRVMLPSLGR